MTPPTAVPTSEPLAIIGIGCLFPRAGDFRAFWANVRNRVDAVAEIPATHWRPEDYLDGLGSERRPDRVYVARGAFLEPVPFPPSEFGIAPNNLEATDTAQLLGLMVAKAALDDRRLRHQLVTRPTRQFGIWTRSAAPPPRSRGSGLAASSV